MRTTIDLPDAVFDRAKKLARDRGITLRELVLEGLRLVVADKRDAGRFQLEDHSFGEGALVDGLAESDWERVRELSYEGRGG